MDINGNMPTGVCQGSGNPKENAPNDVNTWVNNTLGMNKETTTDIPVMNRGSYIKINGGVKITNTTYQKKYPYIPVTIYEYSVVSPHEYGTAEGIGIKNEWMNMDVNFGTDGISYSKSFGTLIGETSMTYSFTNEGRVVYEASGSICWDNAEIALYISADSSWQTAASIASFAVGNRFDIPIGMPLISGAKY